MSIKSKGLSSHREETRKLMFPTFMLPPFGMTLDGINPRAFQSGHLLLSLWQSLNQLLLQLTLYLMSSLSALSEIIKSDVEVFKVCRPGNVPSLTREERAKYKPCDPAWGMFVEQDLIYHSIQFKYRKARGMWFPICHYSRKWTPNLCPLSS